MSDTRFPLTLAQLLARVARHRRTELDRLAHAAAMIGTQRNTAYADRRDGDGAAWSEVGYLCRTRIAELQQEEAADCAPWFEVRQ